MTRPGTGVGTRLGTDTVEATSVVVDRISKMLPEGFAELTPEQQINSVLAGFNSVRAGDPLGRVCRNPETGEVAHRVDDHGLYRWHISSPHSDTAPYNNNEPNLPGWDVIYEPEEVPDPVVEPVTEVVLDPI